MQYLESTYFNVQFSFVFIDFFATKTSDSVRSHSFNNLGRK